MKRRTIAVGAAAALVLLAGLGVAFGDDFFATSAGSAEGTDETPSFPTATPTATPDAGSAGDGPSAGGDASAESTAAPEPAFSFEVRRIESCGQTCRDVTSAVANGGDETATNVTVYSRIFVGNSTDSDDLAWQGRERVGTLDTGETYVATKTVELSYAEALAVQNAGGWVTVQTTVQSDERTVTFTRRRNVT